MIVNRQKIIIVGLSVALLLVIMQFVVIDDLIVPALQQDLFDAHNIGYNTGVEDALTGLFQQTFNCQPTNIWVGNSTKQLIDVECLQPIIPAAYPESPQTQYDKYIDGHQGSTVVVYPTFTRSAYASGGFYEYYEGTCDERCLDIPIIDDGHVSYVTSMNALSVLQYMGYPFITDVDLDKNPEIINQYDKVILVHNEYVTQKMFDAIANHPLVVYLYPNALYAEIETDYSSNTMKLIRGHGYPPDNGISNGFDWEFDNTHPYEYDTDCNDWEFHKIDNGYMLNCYPEHIIDQDPVLLKALMDLGYDG